MRYLAPLKHDTVIFWFVKEEKKRLAIWTDLNWLEQL